MLRSKKYNIYKHIGLNYLFDFCTDESSGVDTEMTNDKDDFTMNEVIKETDKYELIKETILEPYILILKNMLIIHIKDNLIHEFEYLYKKSKKYVFDIYETIHPHMREESSIKMYHIICVSKKLTKDINYMSFLKANDSDKKYTCLSLIYGPCLIANRRFDITSEVDKYQAKYRFIKTIGRGIVDTSLRYFIQNMIKMVNEYQTILPPHYLKIN